MGSWLSVLKKKKRYRVIDTEYKKILLLVHAVLRQWKSNYLKQMERSTWKEMEVNNWEKEVRKNIANSFAKIAQLYNTPVRFDSSFVHYQLQILLQSMIIYAFINQNENGIRFRVQITELMCIFVSSSASSSLYFVMLCDWKTQQICARIPKAAIFNKCITNPE